MTIDITYYNVSCKSNSFSIAEVEKQSSEDAITTLKNIERIFQGSQTFLRSFEETSSKKLANIAYTILDNQEKYSFSSLEKEEVDVTCKKIEELVKNFKSLSLSPVVLKKEPKKPINIFSSPLPSVIINLMIDFLPTSDQLIFFLKNYLEESLTEKELEELSCLKNENNEFDNKELEKILKNTSIDLLLKIFSCEEIHNPSFEQLKAFLLEANNWENNREKLQELLENTLEKILNTKKLEEDLKTESEKILINKSNINLKKTIKILKEKGASLSRPLLLFAGNNDQLRCENILTLNLFDINSPYLIERHFNMDNFEIHYSRYIHDWSLFMIAVEKNLKEMCTFLLQNKANINFQDSRGWSPLMLAVNKNDKLMCEFLIDNGANLQDKNKEGQTAFTLAIKRGYKEIYELLFNKTIDIEYLDNEGNTLLLIAIKYRNKKIFEKLLERGAKVNVQDSDGWTPLMRLASHGHADMISTLLKHNPDLDIQSKWGDSALTLAASNNNNALSFLLIKHHININFVNKRGRSALTIAIENENYALQEKLKKEDADINAVNKNRETALMWAVKERNVSFTEQLISLDANINLVDLNENSALMYAVQNEDLSLCKLLIKNGAKTNLMNEEGESVITYVQNHAKEGFRKLFMELIDKISEEPKE